MENKAKEWERTHTGHVTKVTDYSFDFSVTEWDKTTQTFVEKNKYTVMESYFYPFHKN